MAINERVFSLRLDKKTYAEMLKKAKEENRSANGAVVHLIEKWLNESE